MDGIVISPDKIKELQAELQFLKKTLLHDNEESTKRGGPLDSFKEASAFQVSIEAKRSRVKELEAIIANARMLPEKVPGKKIIPGKWFSVDNGQKISRYRLVHPVESDSAKNLISPDSPLGRMVVNQGKGYQFNLNGLLFKIINVE